MLLGFGVAHAEDTDRLTVVELFTSQGCSSCPPADAALRSLRDRPGILPLSWPVDYWDRLGWEDTFAHPHNAMRQAAYNKRMGRGGVFTPQMVMDGRAQCVGSKPDEVKETIADVRAIDRPDLPLSLAVDGQTVKVGLTAQAIDETIAVRVVWFLANAEVEIGDGENRGRRLHYTNVVRSSDILTDWTGKTALDLSLDAEAGRAAGADHVAILLQSGYGHGPIVGAASIPLPVATSSR